MPVNVQVKRKYVSPDTQARRVSRVCLSATLLLSLSMLASNLHAESRALIIGVGEYRDDSVTDLPGIDIDVNIMKRVAVNLGYRESAIRVLQDEEATIENIFQAFNQWLVQGVTADDQVLIYFSGHGSQAIDTNGDETDGLDEFFLAHDFRVENGVAKGALVDDDFFQVLSQIPTENIMLIVDACHSGTGYKDFIGGLSGAAGGVSKYHAIKSGHPVVDGSFADAEKGSSDRFVALMAADDNETSIATSRGSVFTLGVEQALKESLGQGTPASARQIVERTRVFVREELARRPELIFTPQIGGDQDLVDKPIRLVPATGLREELLSFVNGAEKLSVSTNKKQYPLGDRSLRITVDVPVEGYLNILTVDPNDAGVVLYPNKFNPDNRVPAGSVSLPTAQMNFDLEAQGPVGEHVIIAFWTPHNVNMYTDGKGVRDVDGILTDAFSEVSTYSTMRFMSVARQSSGKPAAGFITVDMIR